jgi:hypothetical protein
MVRRSIGILPGKHRYQAKGPGPYQPGAKPWYREEKTLGLNVRTIAGYSSTCVFSPKIACQAPAAPKINAKNRKTKQTRALTSRKINPPNLEFSFTQSVKIEIVRKKEKDPAIKPGLCI